MTSLEINGTTVTTAAVIAGRSFSADRTARAWGDLCERVDALGARLIIQTDLLNWRADEELFASAVVGLAVAVTDSPFPTALAWDELRTAVERASTLPWLELEQLIGAPFDDDTRLWAVATGPLAGVCIAFGVAADDESECLEWTAGSPQSEEPTLDHVAGKDMEQRRVKEGVWGLSVAYAGDWGAAELVMTQAAHEARLLALRTLAGRATYFLMSSYD